MCVWIVRGNVLGYLLGGVFFVFPRMCKILYRYLRVCVPDLESRRHKTTLRGCGEKEHGSIDYCAPFFSWYYSSTSTQQSNR